MNFAAVVGFCAVWAMPYLRNNPQRHTRNQPAGDPLIEGETLFRVGHPPLWTYLELADLDASEYDSGQSGLWTRGLLIRRNLADGECAYFTTW
jgi:SRSO17 transposase